MYQSYFPARVLQKRWKNLRDCYTRELFRIVKVKANGKIDRKKGYVFFNQLSFLKKVIKPTSRTTEISANELEALKNELQREDTNDQLEDMDVEKQDKASEDEFQDYTTLPGGFSEEDFNIQPNYTVNIEDIFTGQSTASRQSKSVDCDTLFLISLARDLQEIPEEHKLDVKIELMQVLKMAKKRKSRVLARNELQQRELVVKTEAESESLDDTDEQSRDSIKDPSRSDLLEKDM